MQFGTRMAHMPLKEQEGIEVERYPLMFRSTIWLEHDQEASARAHEEPIEQLRDRVCTMEHNLETLRTRLTQVADLRDAQGIREDHRALVTRLTEVEECASVHTLREFMSKIHRLESMLSGKHGGVIGEAIRACNRRLDNHRATMDDFYARISTQDWYHDLSDQEDNEENRLSTREDVELEVRRHSADSRERCLDHHHHHQHRAQKNQQHSLLR